MRCGRNSATLNRYFGEDLDQGLHKSLGLAAASPSNQESACSKSSIKSSGCSRPIEQRNKLSGEVVPGPSIDARCSIKLSTPPKLVARVKISVLAATRIAASRPPFASNESIPPNSDICFFAMSYPGCDCSPG